jgi:hypothetical protein
MDVGLLVAGIICMAMGFGHETIGVVWVLPGISKEHLPKTPFGPPSMSLSMVRVTWHIVTIFVLALGGAFITLAADDGGDAQAILLRWFAGMWLAATAMALWVIRRSIRSSLRLPVPVLWAIVALLCWGAAT